MRGARAPRDAVARQGEDHRPRAMRGQVRGQLERRGAGVRTLAEERRGRADARAIEVEVGARDGLDPHEVATRRPTALVDREERFAEYWRGLAGARAGRRADGGRAPRHAVPGVVPAAEASCARARADRASCRCEAELSGGELALSGRIDLVLGRSRSSSSPCGPPARDRPEDRRRLPRVRRGHAVLRADHDAAFRRAALPRRVVVPREGGVAGRRRREDSCSTRRTG